MVNLIIYQQLNSLNKCIYHPLLEKFLRKGVTKLTKDECYSEDMRMEFESYRLVGGPEEVSYSYSLVKDLIGS